MKKSTFLLSCLVLVSVQIWAEADKDQQRKDSLLNLHRTIMVSNIKTAGAVHKNSDQNYGAVVSLPVDSPVVEGGSGVVQPEQTPVEGSATNSPTPDVGAVVNPASSVPGTSPDPTQLPKTASAFPSLLDNNLIVAFYGNPFGSKMGILGEQSMDETARLLKLKAAEWDALNGDQHVVPAFHLIYATVWTDANVGVLSDKVVQQYIDYAAANDIIVILDHQLGKYDVAACITRMLKWLKYPNVHLAIDPEWKTLIPGKEIGSIRAEDVNKAQELIQEYLVKENIQQKKMFIVHQFNWKMITNRERVRSDFDRIDLIHNADGFGPPDLKLSTYAFIALAKNMPIKGFKLFFPKSWKSDGYDKPMMSPQQVLNLNPKPVYINYQ